MNYVQYCTYIPVIAFSFVTCFPTGSREELHMVICIGLQYIEYCLLDIPSFSHVCVRPRLLPSFGHMFVRHSFGRVSNRYTFNQVLNLRFVMYISAIHFYCMSTDFVTFRPWFFHLPDKHLFCHTIIKFYFYMYLLGLRFVKCLLCLRFLE